MEIHTIGIDLAKTIFHLVGVIARGEVVVRKKCSRNQLLRFTSNLRVSLIGMDGLRRVALPGPGSTRAGARWAADASPVCEAVREDQQERLH
jgi:hypothetical protein